MIHLICPNPAVDRTLLFKTIEYSVPNRPIEVREFPGGKSFNVAYALTYEKDLSDIMIHTMIGGLYGTHLVELAAEKGYKIEATMVEKNTRLCNILVDMTEKEILPIYEAGFDLNAGTLDLFTEKLISSINNNDIIVFSGSLMKGMPSNYISQVVSTLKKRQVNFKLCVDTSGKALVTTYHETNPYLIKINDEEIQDIFPEKKLVIVDDYLALLTKDIKKEIPNFVITLGKEGIVGRIDGELYRGFAEPVKAKNPIACGDFFLGRLVRGIANNDSAEKMLKSSLLFSTCNAMNWYPEITKEQLKHIGPTITVKRIQNNKL